jgi:hypothetical protein
LLTSAEIACRKGRARARRIFPPISPAKQDANRLESLRDHLFSVESGQSAAAVSFGMGDAKGFAETCGASNARRQPSQNVRNRWVNFRISDVYIPEPGQILTELHGKDLLQGKVIDVSDSGTQQEAFVVVEVEGLKQPVVVPMNRIRGSVCE